MAKVTFKRVETNAEVNNIPILDGQLIYTGEGKTYIDYETQRVPINGTPDSAMSDSSTNPVENNVIKEYVDTNISTLDSKIHNGTILWTNQNPTSSLGFVQQNITLANDSYDILIWLFLRQYDQSIFVPPVFTIKGYGGFAIGISSSAETRRRGITYVDDTTYNIGECSGTEVNNNALIPMYVIGINTGLFE